LKNAGYASIVGLLWIVVGVHAYEYCLLFSSPFFYLLDEVIQESGSWVWGMSALLVEDAVLLVVCAV